MEIGFTGTQHGMTYQQAIVLYRLLEELKPDKVHHGDCVKSDETFHNLVRQILPQTFIVIHPPTDPKKRAFCEGDLILEPEPYINRNHKIVIATAALIATPRTEKEIDRSGTWATVRYSRKRKKPRYIIYPNGEVSNV